MQTICYILECLSLNLKDLNCSWNAVFRKEFWDLAQLKMQKLKSTWRVLAVILGAGLAELKAVPWMVSLPEAVLLLLQALGRVCWGVQGVEVEVEELSVPKA